MIHYIKAPEEQGVWGAPFNRCMLEILSLLGPVRTHPFLVTPEEILPNLQENDIVVCNIMHIANAYQISRAPGRRFKVIGYEHQLPYSPFHPDYNWGSQEFHYDTMIDGFDLIFCSTKLQVERLLKNHAGLNGKLIRTGFPIDYGTFSDYQASEKQDDLVVFNQRFSMEKGVPVEIEVASQLVAQGYRVQHFIGVEQTAFKRWYGYNYSHMAKAAGIEFCFYPRKDDYYRALAKARYVITTTFYDSLSVSMVEAAYLGCLVIAPDAFAFREFLDPQTLYQPYSIHEIMSLVHAYPTGVQHRLDQFDWRQVAPRMAVAIKHVIQKQP